MPGNNCGAPEHTPTHYALQHLEKLLQSISQKLKAMTDSELFVEPPSASSNEGQESTSDDVSFFGALQFTF